MEHGKCACCGVHGPVVRVTAASVLEEIVNDDHVPYEDCVWLYRKLLSDLSKSPELLPKLQPLLATLLDRIRNHPNKPAR